MRLRHVKNNRDTVLSCQDFQPQHRRAHASTEKQAIETIHEQAPGKPIRIARYRFSRLMRFTTTLQIVSFSAGLLSAMSRVRATKALSANRLEPSLRYRRQLPSKNQMNRKAPMRLFPSTKAWFLLYREHVPPMEYRLNQIEASPPFVLGILVGVQRDRPLCELPRIPRRLSPYSTRIPTSSFTATRAWGTCAEALS